MSSRLSAVFRQFVRTFDKPNTKQVSRRKLIHGRYSGPRSISVFYRVEEIPTFAPGFKHSSIRQCLETCRSGINHLKNTLTMSSKEPEASSHFTPPASVRGMKTLNKSLFSRSISIPGLKVPSKHINALSKTLKVSLLKMQRVKPVAELASDDPLHASHKLFLLNPTKFKTMNDFSEEQKKKLSEFGVDVDELSFFDLEVGYENWTVPEVLRAVLPETADGVSGYSIIGHIAHLNLKAEVLDYKHLIGEVILDKNSSVKTVVNKVNIIDNTYRNFQMELLAGEDNLVTCAKENGCVFQMDFSKVYWNPRLSTEHERVVQLLSSGDILYDVFAGIGPFAIPAAKRGAVVYANDLNPHSFAALNNNIKLNKVKAGRLHAYNLDGRDFIRSVVRADLMSRLQARARACVKTEQPTSAVDSDPDVANTQACRSATEAVTSGEGVIKNVPKNASDSLECSTQNQETSQDKTKQKLSHPNSGSDNFHKLYIAMNLPALALEFLDAFCGLLSDLPRELWSDPTILDALPLVMCYCFEGKKEGVESDVKSRAEKVLGYELPSDSTVRSVRNVAPGKEMMCLVFQLTPKIVFGDESRNPVHCAENIQDKDGEPPTKKQRVSETV